jgi:2'-5' RNA ligase
MARLFVAVDLPAEIKAKIDVLGRQIEEPALKLVEPENLHVTLQFLGEVEEGNMNTVVAALRKVKMAAFEIEIAGVGAFPSATRINVVWLACKGLLPELAAKVAAGLLPLGFKPDKPFASHLTIARVKYKPEKLPERLINLQNVTVGKMKVERFVLKKSTLTPEGPIYEDIATFELKG